METNWTIIGIITFIAIVIIVLLVRKNLKDEKDVAKHFNQESSIFKDEDSELNDV